MADISTVDDGRTGQAQTHVEPLEVPDRIRSAERWRKAGDELRELDPELFDALVVSLVMSKTRDDDDLDDGITKSYFVT